MSELDRLILAAAIIRSGSFDLTGRLFHVTTQEAIWEAKALVECAKQEEA